MALTAKQWLTTPYIYWLGRRMLGAIGLLGLFGILCLLASIIFVTNGIALKHDIESQQILLAEKQLQADQPIAEQVANTPQDQQAELSAFYDEFPNKSDLSSYLLLLKQKSTQHKVPLNQGRYKYTLVSNNTHASQFAKYEIKFPISGRYVNIRAFIDDVLLQLPTLALQEVHLQREAVTDKTIDADLGLVLFVKGEH